MMKILFVSKEGDSSGLWYLCKKQGDTVKSYIKEKWARRIMDGIIPKCETLEEGLSDKPEVIVFDLNGMGKEADAIRKSGHKVVCGSELSDKLEFDRAWGVNICKQYGIRTPKTTEFSNYDQAIAHVKKTNKPYAIKIDSNNGGESASYVGKDTQDMLDYLEHSKEEGKVDGSKFILQEVVKGAEISTELWLANGDPIWPCNSTFETKKFQAGELGQRTGCESSLVFHYEGRQSKVFDKTIKKILPLLKHSQYTGCIDVNCIVSEDDHEPYFLEWTPRLGYSAIYALTSILGLPIADFFGKVSRGTFTIPFKNLWGASLKISIPPYPVYIEDEKSSGEVYGTTEGVRINGKYGNDFIPIDVEKGKRTEFQCSGTTAIIGECLGRGNTLMEAWRSSQRVFKTVEVPNSQGRYTDGAEDAWKRVLKLKNMGYDIPSPISAGGSQISSTPSKATAPR